MLCSCLVGWLLGKIPVFLACKGSNYPSRVGHVRVYVSTISIQ